MIEYLEDLIENNPAEEFAQEVQESGQYMHRTGDDLFDEWQRKAAAGEKIDFEEAFEDEESKAIFEAVKAKSRKKFADRNTPVPEKDEVPDEIHDDYTKGGG